jgi:DNA-binding NarL/FixJ family response regulator
MMNSRLLIVEDDVHFCHWAKAELETHPRKFLISIAQDLPSARQWLAGPEADELAVALIDLHLHEHSGVDLIKELAEDFPQVAVLVLTSVDEPDEALAAIRAGAQGYVLKNTLRGELTRAVEQMLQGGAPISPGIAQMVLQAFRGAGAAPAPAPPASGIPAELLAELTARETEVFGFLARGYSDKEVAARLGIAATTVDTHVRSVYRKLSINSRSQLRNLLHKY